VIFQSLDLTTALAAIVVDLESTLDLDGLHTDLLIHEHPLEY